MADSKPMLNITQDQLQELLTRVLAAANKPNALEQKKLDEELEKDRRRGVLAVELGYASELQRYNQQHSCTHCRDDKSGQSVRRGTGTYTTGGQQLGNGNLLLVCLRCSTEWIWKPSPQELDYAQNAGLLGYPPPDISRCENRDQFITTLPIKPEVTYA